MKLRKKIVESLFFFLGGAIGIFATWYAYFGLKRISLPLTIFSMLFFGSAILAGMISFRSKKESDEWFKLNPQSLSKNQIILLGIGSFILGICSLWIAIDPKMIGDLKITQGEGSLLAIRVIRGLFIFIFLYCCIGTFIRFKQAIKKTNGS